MTREEAVRLAERLVGQMTIEEMISQLSYDAPAIDRLEIPAYNWWNEALHGVARAGTATVFPQAIGLAATFDRALVKEEAEAISTEARAKYNESSKRGDRGIYKGLTMWSPNVNIFRDPRWGRGHETYGEDPFLTGEMGAAFVEGLQGNGEYLKTAACAKHFAVHSGPEAIRHSFNSECKRKDMAETYLPAFKKLVKKAGVEAVMGAYNRVNGEACCASPFLQGILRRDWAFKGHFVSDFQALKDIHSGHGLTADAEETSALALKNGCDLNAGTTYRKGLEQAFEDGKVDAETIRTAAVRLFTTRFLLGVMKGQKTEFDGLSMESVESPAHIRLARRAAEESAVLLKNDGLLPLKKQNIRSIAVVGPNADDRHSLDGNYHGTAGRYVTALEGIRNCVGDDVRIYYSVGCALNRDRTEDLAEPDDRLAEAAACCELSDVVICVLGLNEFLEGEEGDDGNQYISGDKADISLPASQQRLLETVASSGRPFVVVLMAGSDIDLSYAADHANAILDMWYPGEQGGNALADILFGKVSPSGKLPVTFYRSIDDVPPFTSYDMEGRTYRYLRKDAQYPFGYGLTYGDCAVTRAVIQGGEEAAAAALQVPDEGLVTIEAGIENRSDVITDEVIQVYVRAEDAKDEKRNCALCGFERVHLKGHEEKTIQIRIAAEDLLVVNEEGKMEKEGSRLHFWVGTSQPDRVSARLTGRIPVEFSVRLV